MRTNLLACTLIALCMAAGSAFGEASIVAIDGKALKSNAPVEAINAALNCAGMIEVSLNNSYNGDNTSAANNVTTYGCSTWNESGGEVVFHLYLATPTKWRATLTQACDLDLAVLSACDEGNPSCLIVADTGVITNSPVSGDFYFVVDGYAGAACTFTLTFEEIPAASFCALAEPLACASTTLAGSTCGGQNLVTSAPCIGYTENGFERYYAVTLNPGGTFTATVTFPTKDGALWVLDGCVEPFTCLVGADDGVTGDPETVTYMNTGVSAQTVYLVVDSYGTSSCGDFTGTFECTDGTVASQAASWGTMKTLYR